MQRLLSVFAVFCALVLPTAAALADEAWDELSRPGAIVLLRHAAAPGVGDPAHFRLDDCATQRNLSDAGRAEARRLGERFRERRVEVGRVLSSQWCRTRETARLAFGERVRDEPAFNSTFAIRNGDQPQLAQARAILARWSGPGTLVVVTHQVNIHALANVSTSSAEGVVMRATDGRLRVLGTLAP